jgi:hypothetical protein
MRRLVVLAVVACMTSALVAQQAATQTQTAPTAIPNFINYSGVLKTAHGSVTGVTFLLYREELGGAPLWLETQNVAADASGHYNVHLGVASNGLPADLFQSGEARWLAVQAAGEQEQPRVLLVAVPYAMKAGDAATVGGLPPSAFVLAAAPIGGGNATSTAIASANGLSSSLSGTGTTDFLPLWTSSTALGSSALFQTGSGSGAKIGINTTTPAAMLDVKGSVTIRALLNLPATANATASTGANSNQIGFVASAFNSSTHAAVNEVFRWLAEPTGNNTSAPSATLNMLFGSAPATPAETGLKINHKGQITFAPGQTFPANFDLSGTLPGFIGLGANTSGAGNLLTVSAGASAAGSTDQPGGDLILAAGDGTGSGASGAVRLQAATGGASGTSSDVLVDRYYVAPKPFLMSSAQFPQGPPVNITLLPNAATGLILRYTIFAAGNGNFASQTGGCEFVAVTNPTGREAAQLTSIDSSVASTDPGGLCAFVGANGFEVQISVTDELDFTPTTHTIYYQIENISGSPFTIGGTPSALHGSVIHTDAQHRTVRLGPGDFPNAASDVITKPAASSAEKLK